MRVLFGCVHNAGRSLMAEALFNRHASPRAEARSAGSRPASRPHPEVVEVMSELGIDLSRAVPQGLSDEVTEGVDVVVTMGCGDECPVIPGAKVQDWELDDPHGRDPDEVRRIRDDIAGRVRGLIAELGV